ncbi:MAG: hypothetical protein L0207_05990, partial [Chlamydiae bacterium]|nr:hypothetical protein [Chlamydiota bacterium]
HNTGYIPQMDSKRVKKYWYQKDNSSYVIEKDLVGWYLIIYNDRNANRSSEDYLFDTLEDAFFEAKEKFNIPKSSWKEILVKDEDKKQVLTSFLETIEGISDKEYQKKAWIMGETADFDETVCLFFGEGDSILEKYKDFGITEAQYQALKKFRDEFETFSDEHGWPQTFIDTPEWAKIMKMAKEILKAFNYQKK